MTTDAELAGRLVREAGTLAQRMRGDGLEAEHEDIRSPTS